MYGRMPLFPPACSSRSRMCMPVFDDCRLSCGSSCCEDCQTVRICNPACRDEYVDVELCVDGDGNLSISVHRPNRPCRQQRHRPKCGSEPWCR